MDNNHEFDYSGLYHNGTPQNGAPQTPPAQPGQQPQAAQAQPAQPAQPQAAQQQPAYPNVGSTGMNTANTAPTDYAGQGGYPPQQPGAYSQQGATPPPAADNNGYTSSFSGGNGNGGGGNGGNYNGYSYASAPQQPPKKQRKKGNGKKVLLRVAAGACILALGVGGGFGGAVIASRAGLLGGNMVVQTIQRDTSNTTAQSQGSADGQALSTQDVAAIASPSVVVITTEQMVSADTWFGGSYVQSGAGSGVIMSQDGYIMTCAHVVNGASSIKVTVNGSDQAYEATVVGGDTTADIAIIKIEATGLTAAVMGDSDALAVGESVVAVGNPLGTLGGTVTTGIISAVNRSVTVNNNQMSLIQTNASISPGNSGGGLFNGKGELIGIVNAKSGYSEAEGLGFAIPINSAMSIAQELIDNGHVTRPGLGISVISIADADTAAQYGVTNLGVYIAKVTEGGGAATAGLQNGDRIVSIDDTVVSAKEDVTNYIDTKQIGDTVKVQVERAGKLLSVDVVLGERG